MGEKNYPGVEPNCKSLYAGKGWKPFNPWTNVKTHVGFLLPGHRPTGQMLVHIPFRLQGMAKGFF